MNEWDGVLAFTRFAEAILRMRADVDAGDQGVEAMFVAHEAAQDMRNLSEEAEWKATWNEFREAVGPGRFNGMTQAQVCELGERIIRDMPNELPNPRRSA